MKEDSQKLRELIIHASTLYCTSYCYYNFNFYKYKDLDDTANALKYLGALDLLGIPILLMGFPPNLSIIIIGNPGSPK